MDYLYVLRNRERYLYDLQIYKTKEEAMEASIRHPECRVEIFAKKDPSISNNSSEEIDEKAYHPTGNYYIHGIHIHVNSK
jgi:hypothetical protein